MKKWLAKAKRGCIGAMAKKDPMDFEWKVVEPGEELDYNFYRVTVRMKQSE